MGSPNIYLDNSLSNCRSLVYDLFLSEFTNQVSGQWPPSGAAPFENETSVEDRRYRVSLRGEGHSVGKSCPARSLLRRPRRPELGLMLLTAQVVRGSVGSLNVMVGDRLELDACDLELVCTLYLVPSTFEVSGQLPFLGSVTLLRIDKGHFDLSFNRCTVQEQGGIPPSLERTLGMGDES